MHLKHIFGASIDEELLMKVLQLVVSVDANAGVKKKVLVTAVLYYLYCCGK